MPRNLVLCLDGTNNEYSATNTNVVKIYAMLDRGSVDQLTYYQPGIGTFLPPGVWGKAKKWVLTRLDLAVAWLLKDHVCDAYRFLMRYYEPGDRIYIFGFSRGAYTARVLAAMLFKVGLLRKGNDELIPFAWDAFKPKHDMESARGFKATFSREVRVHFLGVWDTVSSVGWAWHPRSLQFTADNPIVDIIRHAISLDERRAYFPQNLWTHTPKSNQDVRQVWFPGVHCDVGGGYAERQAGLSKIALQWMLTEAQKDEVGLWFDKSMCDSVIPSRDTDEYVAPSAIAQEHKSLKGLWWLVEYLPKLYKDPNAGYRYRLMFHKGRPRYVAENSLIHKSVRDRMAALSDYRPKNLPHAYVTIE